MDFFRFSAIAQRVKHRNLLKREMARAQFHPLSKNVEEKEAKSDSRRSAALKNKIQEKGLSKNMKSRVKKQRKKRKRWNEGISSNGSNKRGRWGKKKKFVLDDSLDDSNDEIEILGEIYCNCGRNDSLDHEIEILSETNVNCVQHCDDDSSNSHDSDEDDIEFLGETFPNSVNSADGFESNENETEESGDQGKDVEVSCEHNPEETEEFESIKSDFAYSSRQEDKGIREENGNDDVGTEGTWLNNSNPRTEFEASISLDANNTIDVKEPLDLEDKTSFDCSNESLPSAETENDESDYSNESLPSSDTEPDDSDDEDFNIEHYSSSDSEEPFSSSEDEADTIENTTEVDEEKSDEKSIEEGTSDVRVHRGESSGEKQKGSIPILQEPSGRETLNEIPKIHEETNCQNENLCYDDVVETECSRISALESESSVKKSKIGALNLQESCLRESLNERHENHKETEGRKENLGHNTVEEVECSGYKKENKMVQGLPKFTKSKPVVNEPHCQKQSCFGMKKQKRTYESSKENHVSKLNDNAVDEMCEGKAAAISKARKSTTIKKASGNKESNMRVMEEDPSKESSYHPNFKRPKTSHCSTGSHEKNEYEFSSQINRGLHCEQLAKNKKVGAQRDNHLSRVLIESILGRSKVLEEQSCNPEAKESCEPEGKQPSSTGRTLPLKFRFEDDSSKPVEKSDYENMVEGLFSEMYICVYLDMRDDSPQGAHTKPNARNVEENRMQSCPEGKHDLIIQEHIGEVCRRCNHVEREMKHVLPDFAKMQRSGKRKYVDKQQFSGFNVVTLTVNKFGESFNGTDGTVWDMIPGVKATMYQHQQEGFEFLWKNLEGTIDLAELKSPTSSNVGGCIISHAPGTGKTRLTIVFIETYLKLFPNARPVIIAPASMLLTWEEEFTKWKVEFPFHNLNNLELSGKEHKKPLENISVSKCRDKDVRLVKLYSWSQEKSILGVSYHLYDKLVGKKNSTSQGSKKGQMEVVDEESEDLRKILLEMPRLVVLDEGHTPRNQRSCIWNTLLKLQTEKRIILSGTPFQNNFGELFNTLHLVRPTIAKGLTGEKAFAEMIPSRGKYLRKKYREKGTSVSSSRVEDVEKLIEKLKERMAPFVHLHKGSILQKSLPGLRDCVIVLNPPPLQKRCIEKMERTQGTFQYEHKVALLSVHPSLLRYCLLSDKESSNMDQDMLERFNGDPNAGVKTRFIMELVHLSGALNEKVLIFSQYIPPLRLIKDQLREHFGWEEGKQIFEMQGKLDQKIRQGIMKIFNDPKSVAQVLLASTKCCSEGINLVGASRIALLDVVWNPSVERQAISRAYRLGQKKVVFTYHLMTSGTTEADKYCRQAEKDRLSELVFSSTIKENDKQKNPSSVFDDRILEEMVRNDNLKDMFEKIIYQPKEVNLVETFGSASLI